MFKLSALCLVYCRKNPDTSQLLPLTTVIWHLFIYPSSPPSNCSNKCSTAKKNVPLYNIQPGILWSQYICKNYFTIYQHNFKRESGALNICLSRMIERLKNIKNIFIPQYLCGVWIHVKVTKYILQFQQNSPGLCTSSFNHFCLSKLWLLCLTWKIKQRWEGKSHLSHVWPDGWTDKSLLIDYTFVHIVAYKLLSHSVRQWQTARVYRVITVKCLSCSL